MKCKVTPAQVRQIRRLIDDKAERLPEIEAEIEVLKAEKKKLKATQSYQAIVILFHTTLVGVYFVYFRPSRHSTSFYYRTRRHDISCYLITDSALFIVHKNSGY